MNTVRHNGVEMGGHAVLIHAIDLALDLSRVRPGECQVFADGAKIAGFTGGERTWPPKSDRFSSLNLAEIEAQAIARAMRAAEGDTAIAARMLGIGRTTLYNKLRAAKSVTVLSRAA